MRLRNMHLLMHMLYWVILLAQSGEGKLTIRLLSKQLEVIVEEMESQGKSVMKKIQDLTATMETTSQRLASIEKRFSDQGEKLPCYEKRLDQFGTCSQQLVTLEKRLSDIENHLNVVAAIEAGRQVQHLRRGLEKEKAATQLRFESVRKTQEYHQSEMNAMQTDTQIQLSQVKNDVAITLQNEHAFLVRFEKLETTQYNLNPNTDILKGAIDAEFNYSRAQLSKVEQDISRTVHATNEILSRVEILEKTGMRGLNGSPGSKGETGLPGEGLPGEKGEPGLPGKNGEPGSRGLPGLDFIGSSGLPGINGNKGDRGEPGSVGLKGEPGPIGPQGSRGFSGSPGMTGRDGLNGHKGDQGLPGLHGLKGEPGPIGPQGSRGLPGSPGMIAWHSLPGRKGD